MITCRYAFLYAGLKNDRLFWGVILTLRRLAIAVVLTVVPFYLNSVLFIMLFFVLQLGAIAHNFCLA